MTKLAPIFGTLFRLNGQLKALHLNDCVVTQQIRPWNGDGNAANVTVDDFDRNVVIV